MLASFLQWSQERNGLFCTRYITQTETVGRQQRGMIRRELVSLRFIAVWFGWREVRRIVWQNERMAVRR